MKEYQFSINIKALKEKVWFILWNDKTFRDWANYIDEGMYMIGDMIEGNNIHFMSPINNYGVVSKIEKLIVNERITFKHQLDTIGNIKRDNEWSGGTESYTLSYNDSITTLKVNTELPTEQIEIFNNNVPQALKRIKELAEMKYILLSADSNPSVYLAPTELVDNFHKYTTLFYNWLEESPNALKHRMMDGYCYNEKDFVLYLNTEILVETPLLFIETINLSYYEDNIPDIYKECFRYNF